MEQDIINNYTQAAALARQEADKFRKLANTYSLLRLGIFALMIFAIYLTITQDTFTIMAIGFVALLIGFAWLVSRQGKYERQRDYYLDLQRINENEISSLQSNTNLYDNGQRFSNEKHFYSSDLDIFGNASLFQLINRAATSAGNNKLADWLDAPADKQTILLRQGAVKELSTKNEWKKELQTLLLFAKNEDLNQLKNLFKYLHIPLNLPGEKWLGEYARIAPYILLIAIIAAWFYPPVKGIAIFIGLANMGIVFSRATYIRKADVIADKIGKMLGSYASVFNKIEMQELVSIIQQYFSSKA
jgi:hypothetical protein